MNPIDPQNDDQYTITLTSNKLLMTICGMLVVMMLCTMLGIRIERYQHRSTLSLQARVDQQIGTNPLHPYAPPAAPVIEPAPSLDAVPTLSQLQANVPTTPTAAGLDVPPRAALPQHDLTAPQAAPTEEPLPEAVPPLLAMASKPDAVTREASDLSTKPTAQTAKPAPVTAEAEPVTAKPAAPTSTPITTAGRQLVFASPSAPAGSRSVQSAAPRRQPQPQAQATGGSYVVQVVSSQDRDLAYQRARLLKGQGIQAFVEPATINGRPWYRVLAGVYSSRSEAAAVLAQLKRDPQFGAGFVRDY